MSYEIISVNKEIEDVLLKISTINKLCGIKNIKDNMSDKSSINKMIERNVTKEITGILDNVFSKLTYIQSNLIKEERYTLNNQESNEVEDMIKREINKLIDILSKPENKERSIEIIDNLFIISRKLNSITNKPIIKNI